ncbi:MAG TPA: hypothetical protein VGM64_04965 [Lacunisphaera sp.]|jgi:hypothetical protein
MANWEYKVISSGKGGFASPALMEKFINDLGQDQWEIINFHTAPDNPLAFTGLARRTTLRDWTLEDAVAAAARAETDKLRVEFEAKFKAATTGASAEVYEKEPTFAEEKAAPDDGYRRPVDTSRDDDPDAPEDEWQKLSAEDELPTFFDALKPHMRRNQRGPGMSVGLDFLAKKWKLEEADLKGALVECGMQIPGDENAKPVCVEYDGDIFWVNINRRGEIWINTREKPDPVFKIVQGKRMTDEEVAVSDIAGAAAPRQQPQQVQSEKRSQPNEAKPEQRENDDHRENREQSGRTAPAPQGSPARPVEQVFAPKTLLAKIRGMMRRNRRGHGWSGSFSYLTKALKLDQPQLLDAVGEFGLRLAGGKEPVFAEEGSFSYWLNQNSNGEIWINAEERRGERAPAPAAPVVDSAPIEVAAAGTPPVEPVAVEGAATGSVSRESSVQSSSAKTLPLENVLTAVRILMQPKKRGEGVTATLSELAEKLEKSDEQLLAILGTAGLQLPETPKGKPTFAEHGGEIFWLNANAKGQVWLNAKQAAAKKSKAKKAAE